VKVVLVSCEGFEFHEVLISADLLHLYVCVL